MPLFGSSHGSEDEIKLVIFMFVAADVNTYAPEAIFMKNGVPQFDINKAVAKLFSFPPADRFKQWVDDGRKMRTISDGMHLYAGKPELGTEPFKNFESRSEFASRVFINGGIVTSADERGQHIYCIPPRQSKVRVSLAVAGELANYPSQVIRVNWRS